MQAGNEVRGGMSPVAKLVPPHMDKGWSFQIVNRLESHEQIIKAGMGSEVVKAARAFLQGLSTDWLMVEFWERDRSKVDAAAEHLAKKCGVVCTVGEFTREDIGL